MKKKRNRSTLKEELAELDEQTRQEELSLWGDVAGGSTATPQADLIRSPKFREIIAILHEQPLLVAPTLEWLKQKRADVAMAQLRALYTDEQIQQMAKEAQSENS